MEIFDIERLIVARTTTGATSVAAIGGRMHRQPAPPAEVFPFGVFDLIDARNTVGVGGTLIMARAEYLVKIIARGASMVDLTVAHDGLLEAAADALVTALSGNFGAIGGVYTSPVAYREIDGGIEYVHVGGLFEFYASP